MRRSRISRRLKQEPAIKHEELSFATAPARRQKRGVSSIEEEGTGGSKKRVKREDSDSLPLPRSLLSIEIKTESAKVKDDEKSGELQWRKLKAYSQYAKQSPFPDFAHPTPEECRLGHSILQKLHGARPRPEKIVARSDRAGCGDSPCVLDALVRTILSQNTSDTNSTRAKKSMDQVYGGDGEGNANSDYWDRIVAGGQGKLQEAIKCGGLSAVKSKVIINILTQTKAKHGRYSLDHLLDGGNTALSNEEAMAELISFRGVGPKTASCVLLFCLQRDSFAVDTHVHRITGLLGWRPKSATRDETHQHLDVRIPDEDKYGLHVLLVTHGRECNECRAGGRNLGKCELRRAFKKGKIEGEGEGAEDVKKEEGVIKQGGNSHTARLDLRPAGVANDSRAQAQTDGLAQQGLQLLLATFGLQSNLRLALILPAAQQRCVGGGGGERLVARQGGVAALGGDLALCHAEIGACDEDEFDLVGRVDEYADEVDAAEKRPMLEPEPIK
ncbi:hypothetical protein DV737_g1962, partial [Chaetothyriales sp. CBS 132003]